MTALWIELLLLAVFIEGALLVKWRLDREFPSPVASKKGALR